MADRNLEFDVFRDVLEEAEAVGRLARTEKPFVAAYEAFRSEDRKAFQAVLKRLRLLRWCHRVCHWIRIKECLFLCHELCGPPRPFDRPPNPRTLAEAIVRITSDERAVRQLAKAVETRDRRAFQRVVRAHDLGPICHLFCHWVCWIRYGLVCRWVCEPELVEKPDLVAELRAAGQALGVLLEDSRSWDEAVAASEAGDAEKLRSVIERAGLVQLCPFICFFFCSWRCVLVCLRLCVQFPIVAVEDPLQEAFAFAKATRTLAEKQPAELRRLSAAVGAGDDKAVAAIVERLELQRFCLQLCHWLCFLRCRRFCIPICPDPYYDPIFTHVGHFHISADIDSGTGRTNKSFFGHGGPNYGFFECLELRGLCPKVSPTNPGVPMRYRFRYESPPGNVVSMVGGPGGGLLCPVVVGSRYIQWPDKIEVTPGVFVAANFLVATAQTVVVAGDGATPDPTSPQPVPGDPWFAPPTHVDVPDGDGWVEVDQNAWDGAYSNALLGFRSPIAFPGGPSAPPGLAAGQPVTGGDQRNGSHAAIIFEATRVGGPTSPPDFTNTLSNIHINNWHAVALHNLLQFHTGSGTPCSPLSTDLDIEYTVDHELIAAWNLQLTTAATPAPTPALPPINNPPADNITTRGGFGTHHENITAWPSCSYIVWLHTRRSLTTGLVDDTTQSIPLSFCK